MTWGVRIVKSDGSVPEDKYTACQGCKHGVYSAESRGVPCNVAKLANIVANLLTSIDVGSDGHMASGSADLKCNGFEAVEPASAA